MQTENKTFTVCERQFETFERAALMLGKAGENLLTLLVSDDNVVHRMGFDHVTSWPAVTHGHFTVNETSRYSVGYAQRRRCCRRR